MRSVWRWELVRESITMQVKYDYQCTSKQNKKRTRFIDRGSKFACCNYKLSDIFFGNIQSKKRVLKLKKLLLRLHEAAHKSEVNIQGI